MLRKSEIGDCSMKRVLVLLFSLFLAVSFTGCNFLSFNDDVIELKKYLETKYGVSFTFLSSLGEISPNINAYLFSPVNNSDVVFRGVVEEADGGDLYRDNFMMCLGDYALSQELDTRFADKGIAASTSAKVNLSETTKIDSNVNLSYQEYLRQVAPIKINVNVIIKSVGELDEMFVNQVLDSVASLDAEYPAVYNVQCFTLSEGQYDDAVRMMRSYTTKDFSFISDFDILYVKYSEI